MATKNQPADPIAERLDSLIRVTQDLLILQALQAGITAGDVRKMLHVNTDRVSNISRYLNRAKRS